MWRDVILLLRKLVTGNVTKQDFFLKVSITQLCYTLSTFFLTGYRVVWSWPMPLWNAMLMYPSNINKGTPIGWLRKGSITLWFTRTLMKAAPTGTWASPVDEHFGIHVLCDRLLPAAGNISIFNWQQYSTLVLHVIKSLCDKPKPIWQHGLLIAFDLLSYLWLPFGFQITFARIFIYSSVLKQIRASFIMRKKSRQIWILQSFHSLVNNPGTNWQIIEIDHFSCAYQ